MILYELSLLDTHLLLNILRPPNFIHMSKISKSSTKKTRAKVKKVSAVTKKTTKVIKKINPAENKVKAPIKISKTYIPKDTEKYMCDKHLSFFKIKLTEWKKELVKANNEALYHGSMDDNLPLIHI